MQINRGSIWHTYTLQSPEYRNAEKLASNLINTGLFLAILTPSNTFRFLVDDTSKSTKLKMIYENNDYAVRVEGGKEVHDSGACALTANAFFNCINIRLSENKIFYTAINDYAENIICCQKPIIIKTAEDEFFLLPIIRLYSNGIAHVTFLDTEQRNKDLKSFVNNILSLPQNLNTSIMSSIEFASLSILLEHSGNDFIKRKKAGELTNSQLKELKNAADDLFLDEHKITGKYVEYTEILGVNHNLSDLARYSLAIIFSTNHTAGIKEVIAGRDLANFFGMWQGKPSIYVFEHENQTASSLKNANSNKMLIDSLIGKHTGIANVKSTKEYIDHRVFDDFNFFSEQTASLTLLSNGVNTDSFIGTYTEENLMWDNQVKSELRDFISFSYESFINKIKHEKTHIGLAKIQENVISFEEWLRVFSKKYGEIQEFALSTQKSIDIENARKNVVEMLKARMLVIKLIDSDLEGKYNKKITIAFGLIASTSISPIVIKPLFKALGLSNYLKENSLSNFEDAIYFIITLTLVWALIKIMNIKLK